MTRKTKTIRLYGWDPKSAITVEVEAIDHWNTNSGDRAFKVYHQRDTDTEPVLLGEIESGEGQTSRHLFGNVASFGKPRTFWYSKSAFLKHGYTYRTKHESQADAIRELIRDRNYVERSPK